MIPNQVFSFLGEAFKIIFAGGKPKAKKYVDTAKVLMTKSPDVQILGVVSLLARDEESLIDDNISTEVDTQQTSGGLLGSYASGKFKATGSKLNGKGTKKGTNKLDEEDFDDSSLEKVAAQDARIIDLFSLLGFGGKKALEQYGQAKTSKNHNLSF